jgi:hypothetical protein
MSWWLTSFRASTWRRFGYAFAALPVSVVCLVLVLVGRVDIAARYQHWLAVGLTGRDEPPGPARPLRVVAGAVTGLVFGAVYWVLVQDLAFLLFINVAYPLRAYVSLAGNQANLLPWQGWNLVSRIRVHAATGPNPWANTYTTAWGGPTLAGAWLVHAGLTVVVGYPILAWAIRGLTRLQALIIRPRPATTGEPSRRPA